MSSGAGSRRGPLLTWVCGPGGIWTTSSSISTSQRDPALVRGRRTTSGRSTPRCSGATTLFDAMRVADRIREAASQVALSAGGKKIGYTVRVGLIEAGSADD